MNAASQVVAPEIRNRAERLAGSPNEELVLATDGRVRWRGEIVAELVEGDRLLAPRVLVLADESLSGPELERVQERLQLWLRHAINTQLESIVALAEPADLDGAARGIAFQLSEHLGILPRGIVAEEVKGLDQDVRAKMRKHGIKFGAYHIYLPLSLKPAPRELALILYALKHGGIRQPGVSDLPHTVLSGRTSFEIDPQVNPKLYEVAGFKVAGKRAVRVDILERLADIIRPLIAIDPARHQGEVPLGAAEGNGFRVTVEMTSLLGCAGEEFASILSLLGYRLRRTPKVAAPAVAAPVADSTPVEAAPVDTASADTAPADIASADAGSPEVPVAEMVPPASEPDTAEAGAAETAPAEAAPADAMEPTTPGPRASVEADAETPAISPEIIHDTVVIAEIEGTSGPSDASPDAAGQTALAAQDLGGAPPAEIVPAAPAEPQFDEVWFPGGRRQPQEGHRRPHNSHRREPSAATPAEGAEAKPQSDRPARNHQRFRTPPTDGTPTPRPPRPEGAEAPRPPRFEGKRPPRPDNKGEDRRPFESKGKGFDKPRQPAKPFDQNRAPKPERGFDPDSPFAALAALKNRKPE